MTMTRRRSTTSEADEAKTERPTRRRRAAEEEPAEDRPTRRRRSSREADEDERPARRRRGSGDKDERSERPSRRRKGTSGFSAYSAKKRVTSSYADEFKPGVTKDPILIKFLDAEPVDTYHQHWVDEGDAAGKTRHSFVCLDDEYFEEDEDFDKGCPLCDLGETATTYSLWNILSLESLRKPEVLMWRTPPGLTDKLQRLAESKRTSPLDRVDLYFEVQMVKKSNKTEWDIQPIKADEVEEYYENFTALDEDELDSYAEKRFEDRTAIQKVDSYDDLLALAESLD